MGKIYLSHILFILLFFGSCRSKESTQPNNGTFPTKEVMLNELKTNSFKSKPASFLPDSNEKSFQRYLLEEEYFLTNEEQLNVARNYTSYLGDKQSTRAFAMEMFGMASYNLQFVDSSIQAFESALNIYIQLKDSAGIARSYSMLGTLAEINSDYPLAIQYQLKGMNLFDILQDSTEMMDCKIELAYLLKDTYFSISDKYLKEAESYFIRQKDSVQLSALYITMAEINGANNNFETANEYANKCLDIRLILNDSANLSVCYNYLGYLSMARKQWDEAIVQLSKAEEIRKLQNLKTEPVIIYNMAICYSKKKDSAKAINMLLESIKLSSNNPEYNRNKAQAYDVLSSVYAESGKYDVAWQYRLKYESLQDSVDEKVNLIKIHELTMRYQNQEKEKSLKATIQRAEQVKRYNILLTTFAGIIIILLVLSLYLVRQGNRKNVAFKEEQLQNVRKELEIRQEQLITFTQQLADRSRVIQKLESQIQGKPDSSFEPEDEHAFDHLLQMKILTDEDWRVFRLQFDQAFPGLMLRLHARYPFLTGAEQRIFLLIRLCSDTREIADLLGISTESVRKAKYRLKKKLGLSENTAIDDFIRKF